MSALEQDAKRFSEFLLEHYPDARTWKDPVGYCRWYIGKGLIAACVGEDDRIVAMCAARPVDRAGMGVLPCYVNELGENLHIDLLIDLSDDLRSIMAFRTLFGIRFGERKTVAMFRHFEENIRVYPYRKFWSYLVRIKKAKMKKEKKHELAQAT